MRSASLGREGGEAGGHSRGSSGGVVTRCGTPAVMASSALGGVGTTLFFSIYSVRHVFRGAHQGSQNTHWLFCNDPIPAQLQSKGGTAGSCPLLLVLLSLQRILNSCRVARASPSAAHHSALSTILRSILHSKHDPRTPSVS